MGASIELRGQGLGPSDFGAPATEVLRALSAALGPATDDDLLEACPSGQIDRVVRFAELSVLVAGTGSGARFVGWDLAEPSGFLPRLATAEGISVGSTLDEAAAAFGSRLRLLTGDPFGAAFEVDVEAPGRLAGTLTGTRPADRIATLSGGSASCAG